jgi:hypothetical protein
MGKAIHLSAASELQRAWRRMMISSGDAGQAPADTALCRRLRAPLVQQIVARTIDGHHQGGRFS